MHEEENDQRTWVNREILSQAAVTPYLKQLDIGLEMPRENLKHLQQMHQLDATLMLGLIQQLLMHFNIF